MKNSTIKQHKPIGKELVPPFMQEPLGSIMHLCSWSKERLPEYIWIGILRNSCNNKKDYFKKFYHLKEYMLKTLEEPTDKFSTILKLKREDKISLFEKIKEVFGDKVLDPIIIVSNFDKDLRDSFLDKSNTNNKRISTINEIIKKMYDRHCDFAMDVRYSALILKINKIYFPSNDMIIKDAIQKYPLLENDNPLIDMYKISLSSLEGMDFFDSTYDYSKYFYEEMYLMTDCNPKIIVYPKTGDIDLLTTKIRELKKLILKSEEIKSDDKRDVIVGNIVYIYKIVKEIIDNNLYDSIISRFVLRTITEVIVNIKFLCSQEKDNPDIWEAFKDYGNSKYKMIYKRIEEGTTLNDNCKHFDEVMLKLLANETKSEEFLKVSFKDFADKNVRQKFILVDEKDLYDTYYDYDTCFTHGYWGAIRESSLLTCDNPAHNYHSVADTECNQKLINCCDDLIFLIDKIIVIMDSELGVN